ncbi:MAG: DUF433 domain-containing protein [Bryobacteraceae bacterium]
MTVPVVCRAQCKCFTNAVQRPSTVCDYKCVSPMRYFKLITVDPAQMGGVPCVRGLRIPVATVLRLLAGGLTEEKILADYPDLRSEDVRECLQFAAASVQERELPLPKPA